MNINVERSVVVAKCANKEIGILNEQKYKQLKKVNDKNFLMYQ